MKPIQQLNTMAAWQCPNDWMCVRHCLTEHSTLYNMSSRNVTSTSVSKLAKWTNYTLSYRQTNVSIYLVIVIRNRICSLWQPGNQYVAVIVRLLWKQFTLVCVVSSSSITKLSTVSLHIYMYTQRCISDNEIYAYGTCRGFTDNTL